MKQVNGGSIIGPSRRYDFSLDAIQKVDGQPTRREWHKTREPQKKTRI